MGRLLYHGDGLNTTTNKANIIDYTNTESGLDATNVQSAIDELDSNKTPYKHGEISGAKYLVLGDNETTPYNLVEFWKDAETNEFEHWDIYVDGTNSKALPFSSKEASLDGTDLSYVTIGEKYVWNSMQPATDDTLATTDKTIVGAISEVKTTADNASSVANANADTLASMVTTDGTGNVDECANYFKWFNGYDSGTTGDVPYTNEHYMIISAFREGNFVGMQVAIPTNSNGIKCRFYQGDSWGDWIDKTS